MMFEFDDVAFTFMDECHAECRINDYTIKAIKVNDRFGIYFYVADECILVKILDETVDFKTAMIYGSGIIKGYFL